MKIRALILLTFIALVAVGWTFWMLYQAPIQAPPAMLPGDAPFRDLETGKIAEIEVSSPSGHTRLVKQDGRWVLPSLQDYPANPVHVANQLSSLAVFRVTEVLPDDGVSHEEYGLHSSAAIQVVLKEGSGHVLADILFGTMLPESKASRTVGFSQGLFMRVGQGPVFLADGLIGSVFGWTSEWIEQNILQVPPDSLRGITITSDGVSFTLRATNPGEFVVDDMDEGEYVDAGVAAGMMRALSPLTVLSLVDSKDAGEARGFDHPFRFEAETQNGERYAVLIGDVAPDGKSRYIRVQERAGEGASPWTFLVSEFTAQKMAVSRETLVKR